MPLLDFVPSRLWTILKTCTHNLSDASGVCGCKYLSWSSPIKRTRPMTKGLEVIHIAREDLYGLFSARGKVLPFDSPRQGVS